MQKDKQKNNRRTFHMERSNLYFVFERVKFCFEFSSKIREFADAAFRWLKICWRNCYPAGQGQEEWTTVKIKLERHLGGGGESWLAMLYELSSLSYGSLLWKIWKEMRCRRKGDLRIMTEHYAEEIGEEEKSGLNQSSCKHETKEVVSVQIAITSGGGGVRKRL